MTTTNLELPEITTGQSDKATTHNEALGIIDSLSGVLVHDMSTDADYTLLTTTTPEEWQYGVLKVTDTGVVLTAGRNIIVPDNAKLYVLDNATAQTITLKTSAGSGVGVAAGLTQLLYCDGTNVIAIAGAV
ncbi:MAG: hypothetical protein GY734_26975 [Herbaspirillum sp.]|nr:hypothetical protein [Herbaspirillum sp.]